MSLVESFRAAPQRRQLAIVAAAAVAIGAVLIAAYFLLLRTPYAVLFTNLRTMDAATIVAELDKKKVAYRLEDGGATIRVPRNLVDSTRLDVMSQDLPIKGTVGFELFNKSDMGLTEFAQKINFQRALQGELARTIMTMDTVDTARVHLSIADETVFRGDRRPSKASVTIVARPGKALSENTVRGIQRLVAAAVPDLEVGDVVVLDRDGKVVSNDVGPEAPPSPQGQERQAVEQYYAAKIRQALASVYQGPLEVVATAGPGPNPPSSQADAAPMADWSPNARRFPLSVAVSFPALPSPQVQQDIRRVASQAVGLDPAMGDILALSTYSLPTGPTLAGAATPTLPTQAPSPVERPTTGQRLTWDLPPAAFWEMHVIPLLLVLLAAAFLLHRFRAGPRRLTARERARYARRLQALLDDGGARAAP